MLLARNLRKSWRNDLAVDGVSLELGKGESVGLLGPNGAGKSTTISMLSTLMPPDSGDVMYRGASAVRNPGPLRRALGIVPQEIALYPELSAQENLEFFGGLYGLRGARLKAATDDALETVGLTDRRRDTIKSYSGGMKRRINMAAALLHEPEILIMDEPTVGIDPQSRNHILESVRRLNRDRGLTVLYTSHYMEEVEQLCDRVYVMDAGRIIADGTIDEVRKVIPGQGVILLQATSYPEQLQAGLERLAGIGSVQAAHDGLRISQNEPVALSEVFRVAEDHDVSVTNLSVQTASLEDVFLHLTGRTLRD